MRVILIDSGTATEKRIDPSNIEEDVRSLIGCDVLASGGDIRNDHWVFVDDDGLFCSTNQFHQAEWAGQKLAGKMVVAGFSPTTMGLIEATMSIEDVLSEVSYTGNTSAEDAFYYL